MSNEGQGTAPGGAPQKSVTDWLMHVIAGKKPIDTPFRGLAQDAAPLKLPESKPEEYASLPISEDAYGTPRFPILPRDEPQPELQVESHVKSSSVATEVLAELAITAADILRDTTPFVPEMPKPAPALTAENQTITAVDILRDPAPYLAEIPIQVAVVEPTAALEAIEPEAVGLYSQPPAETAVLETQPEPILAEVAAEPDPALEIPVPATEAITLLTSEPLEATESSIPSQSEPVLESQTVREAEAQPELVAETPTARTEPTELIPRPEIQADGAVAEEPKAESVWAREDFWADAARESKPETTSPTKSSRTYLDAYLEPDELAEIDKAKPTGWSSAWRTLIRLGSAVPWLARALPTLEVGSQAQQGSALTQDMRQDMAGLRLVQYEIRTTVQDHSAQLKRMEDQLARVRESVEAKSEDHAALAAQVQSAMKLLKLVGIGLGSLLVVLILLAAWMVMKH